MYRPVSKLEIPGIKCPSGVWEIMGERQVGAESMYGTIFSTCCQTDCSYVAKIIPYSNNNIYLGHYTTTIKEIKKEVEIQDTVYRQNPNITIPIIEWYKDEEKSILIMPTLYETVRNALTSMNDLDDMIAIIQDVLDALFSLHSMGVYHGDAHMDNFMLTEEGQVKIIDFGKSWYIKDHPYRMLEDYQDIYISINSLTDDFTSEQINMLQTIASAIETIIQDIDMKIRLQQLGEKSHISVQDIQLNISQTDMEDFIDLDLPDVPSGLPS